jgi:hypothetical protein
MSTGWKFKQIAGVAVLCAGVLTLGVDSVADTASSHGQRKTKKAPQLPPLPSGPTGRPVPAIPLDSMAPVAPQVSYQNSQLTIIAPNSTLGDILRAVKKQTGAEIDIPSAPERVVTHLGPGPAREVVAELLNGSRFNYVLLGSPADDASLTRVVLVVKSGPDVVTPPSGPSLAEQQQLGIVPPGQPISSAQEPAPEANEADAAEENADENADQAAAEAEQQQPQPNPDQPGVKTPQEMLQEMQQRQLMLQQQQPPGQPPVPGAGLPPRPPQEQ